MSAPPLRSWLAGLVLLVGCVDPPDDHDAAPPETEAAAFGDNALPACSDDDDAVRRWEPYTGGCPAPKSCVRIDQPGTFVLPPNCTFDRVEIAITSSDVTLDCAGAVLAGGDTGDGSIGLRVVDTQDVGWGDEVPWGQEVPPGSCTRDHDPLANVTIRNCTVTGYDTGALVRLYVGGYESTFVGKLRDRYLAWFHHPNEREYRMEQIDDCLRAAAPRDVTFDNVDLRGQAGNGLHVFGWVHDVTFANGSIRGAQGGTGVYLSPGSRDNVISNNDIVDNYREGVAIDGSAANRIIDNRLSANGLNWWYGLRTWDFTGKTDFYFVGITLFKNAWEKPTTTGPRTQHAADNEISGNEFHYQDTGVWIGYRQGKDYDTGERGDPIYYVGADGDYNYKKFAERTTVSNNKFYDVRVGVRVQDDGAIVTGNWFLDPREYAPLGSPDKVGVYIGHDVRRAVGEPVRGTIVRNNLFDVAHDYGVLEHDCAVDTVVESNFKGEPEGTWTPVTTNKRDCAGKQARMGAYLSGVGGPSGALTGLRSGAFFKDVHTWLTGDFDGDGLDDLVSIYKADDGRQRLWLHLATGTRFGYQDSFQTLEKPHQPMTGQWLAGNFDGVGGDDLVYVYGNATTTYVYGWRAEGVGFSPHPATARFQQLVLSFTPYNAGHRWLAGDLNLDGRDDLVQVYGKDGSIRVVTHRSADGETFATRTSEQLYGAFNAADQWLLGDVSGDRRADLIQVYADAAGNAVVHARHARATTGFEWESWTQPFTGSGGGAAGFRAGQRWLLSDFDGSGREDVVLIYGASGNARVWRNRSTGAGLVHVGIQTLDGFADNQRWLTGRFNRGDDRDDLALVYPRTWP